MTAFEPGAHGNGATYDEIEQPRADSHYDEVTDALTFNVAGGVATTLYNDGSNSLA